MNGLSLKKMHLKEKKTVRMKMFKVVRELCTTFFWIYVLVKLFVFDIDYYLMEKIFPNHMYILNYKFIIIIGIIAVFWLFMKNKKVIPFILYIVFFPIILFLWKIPYFIFRQKSWTVAIAFINSIISFFINIKFNFIASVLYITSLFMILIFSNTIILWLCIIILSCILLIIYVQSLISIFVSSRVHRFYFNFLNLAKKNKYKALRLDEELKKYQWNNILKSN